HKYDFAVFLITPDDIIEFRGSNYLVARDNVLFEAGLFFTRLGRKRTLLVTPRRSKEDNLSFHLPSDLEGLNIITFRPFSEDEDMAPRLGPATTKIRALIKKEKHLPKKDANVSKELDGTKANIYIPPAANKRVTILNPVDIYLKGLSGGLIYLLRHLS